MDSPGHGLELQMLFLNPPQPSPPIPVLLPAAHPGCSAGLATERRHGCRWAEPVAPNPPPAKPTHPPGHTPHVSLLHHGPSEVLCSPECLSKGCPNRPPSRQRGHGGGMQRDGGSLPGVAKDDGQGSKGFSLASSPRFSPRERLCDSAGGSQSPLQS